MLAVISVILAIALFLTVETLLNDLRDCIEQRDNILSQCLELKPQSECFDNLPSCTKER